jgi:hypothetical protein
VKAAGLTGFLGCRSLNLKLPEGGEAGQRVRGIFIPAKRDRRERWSVFSYFWVKKTLVFAVFDYYSDLETE